MGAGGRRRRAAWLVAAGLALPAAAFLLGVVAGEDVTILVRLRTAEERAEQRRIRDPRDDPAEIYGVPEKGDLRVLFPERSRRIVPDEAPDRVLLHVDRRGGESPLLARTVLAGAAAVGGLLALLGGVLLFARRRRSGYAGTPAGE